MSDESGFEWRGRFYRWHVSDIGKDLMLIDRIAQMPIAAFMEQIYEADDDDRDAPIMLGLVATSLRAGHPEWSVDRIYRTVMELSISRDIEFVYGDRDDEETMPGPPPEPPASEPGRSASNGSSSPSTPEASSPSETSFGIPV